MSDLPRPTFDRPVVQTNAPLGMKRETASVDPLASPPAPPPLTPSPPPPPPPLPPDPAQASFTPTPPPKQLVPQQQVQAQTPSTTFAPPPPTVYQSQSQPQQQYQMPMQQQQQQQQQQRYQEPPQYTQPQQQALSLSPATFGSLEKLTYEFLQECSSPPIDPSNVPRTLKGIKLLARCNMWRPALAITGAFPFEIEKLSSKDTPIDRESLLILSLRLEAMFRLKMFDDLTPEITKLMVHLSYLEDEDGREIPATPDHFALRIGLIMIDAETQFTIGHGSEALGKLLIQRLTLKNCSNNKENEKAAVSNATRRVWNMKLTLSIINMLIRQREWTNAINEMKSLLEEIRNDKNSPDGNDRIDANSNYEILLSCKITRVLIHMGDIHTGEQYLEMAKKAFNSKGKSSSPSSLSMNSSSNDSTIEDYLVLTGGILLQGKDQYESAMKLFSSVIDSQVARNGNITIGDEDLSQLLNSSLSIEDNASDAGNGYVLQFMTEGLFDGTALLAAAVNNYAVCCVFLKKIDVAMKKLENIMQDNPSQNMTDALVFNLCTIYDLSYSPEISANKKKMIQQIAGMYRVEEINWRSFRLA